MKCPACGTQVDEDAKFCNNCGAHLPEVLNAARLRPAVTSGAGRRQRMGYIAENKLLVWGLLALVALILITAWVLLGTSIALP